MCGMLSSINRLTAMVRGRAGTVVWIQHCGRAGDDFEPELEVDLFSLINAFQAVVERAKHRPRVLLPPEQIPVEVRIEVSFTRQLRNTIQIYGERGWLEAPTNSGFEVLFRQAGSGAEPIVVHRREVAPVRVDPPPEPTRDQDERGAVAAFDDVH